MADPEQPLQRQDVERFVRECGAVVREVAACSQRQTAEVLTRVSTNIKNEKVRTAHLTAVSPLLCFVPVCSPRLSTDVEHR